MIRSLFLWMASTYHDGLDDVDENDQVRLSELAS